MQSCLEAQKHQQVEDKAAVTRGVLQGNTRCVQSSGARACTLATAHSSRPA